MTAQPAMLTAGQDDSAVARFVAGFRGLASQTQPLGPLLLSEFADAERQRQDIEERWLKDLRQYRGIYEPEVAARIKGRSQTFGKKTRVKVRSMDDRVFDMLFPAGDERNFAIDPTPEPNIARDQKARLEQALRQHTKAEPNAKQVRQAVAEFAKSAAGRMTSTVEDQLIEARYRRIAKLAIHDGNLYGTGVVKGPLVDIHTKTRFAHDGDAWAATHEECYLPFLDHVPLWRIFPDMAATEVQDCRYIWERHRLTKAKLLELARNPSFDGAALVQYAQTPVVRTTRKPYELEVKQLGLRQDQINDGSYELLERWGWIDSDDLCGCGMGDDIDGMVFANVWLTPDGQVLKFAPQPIKGMTFPYHFYYYDKDETSIFGEGLSAIMRDEQDAFNSARRATFDNLAITAGPQFEIYANQIDPRTRPTGMHPFAIWWRTSGDGQYPAIRAIQAESHVNELSAVAAQCDSEIDEVTGIPKYLYGDGPSQGAGATSSGLSQLLGQANTGVKAQVQSFDDGITAPLIGGMVAWNMQFNPDPSIKGDYQVQATGTKSLVAKEVRSQMLALFSGSLSPMEKTYIKWDKLVAEKAKAHDLGDVVKTAEEVEQEQDTPQAQQQAQLVQAQAQLQVKTMEATVSKLQAEVLRLQADTGRLTAETERAMAEAVNRRVEAAFAAMQAAGVAVSNANIAPAGDEILRSAGWQDATPQEGVTGVTEATGVVPQAVQPMGGNVPIEVPQVPKVTQPAVAAVQPKSPFLGERAGIETPELPQ